MAKAKSTKEVKITFRLSVGKRTPKGLAFGKHSEDENLDAVLGEAKAALKTQGVKEVIIVAR